MTAAAPLWMFLFLRSISHPWSAAGILRLVSLALVFLRFGAIAAGGDLLAGVGRRAGAENAGELLAHLPDKVWGPPVVTCWSGEDDLLALGRLVLVDRVPAAAQGALGLHPIEDVVATRDDLGG